MKLGTKGRYAVMAMVDLTCQSRANPGRGPIVLADIARRQEISLSYLEQLFSRLRKAGLIKSVRGPGGGYVLARPAGDVRISDIVLAVDEPIHTTRCDAESGQGCMANGSRCITHDLWDELGQQIRKFLDGVSLEQVCARQSAASCPQVGAAPAASIDAAP